MYSIRKLPGGWQRRRVDHQGLFLKDGRLPRSAGSNYQYRRAVLDVYKDGKRIRTLEPEQRMFTAGQQQTTTEVALHSTPKEDLYLVLAGVSRDGSVDIKAFVNPLVFWIWFGAAVMFFGALIALIPEKGRIGSTQPELAGRQTAGVNPGV